MAPVKLLLVRLAQKTTIPQFLASLKSAGVKPLTVNKVIRWVILPSATPSLQSAVLGSPSEHKKWDLLLVLAGEADLPGAVRKLVDEEWYVTAGVPSSLLKDFDAKNQKLLYPDPAGVPRLGGGKAVEGRKESSQSLELSGELEAWIREFSEREGKGAVSMFNLLSFKKGMKESYLNYGKAFATDVGASRGGTAKLVGKVINVSSSIPLSESSSFAPFSQSSEETLGDNGKEFDEVAVAHYPSIRHFEDMLRGEDYQAANQKWRVPALRDTFILCTSELADEVREVNAGGKSKL